MNSEKAAKALRSGLERLIAAEPEITRFDTEVGDGDCGVGLKRGAEGVLTTHASQIDVSIDTCAAILNYINQGYPLDDPAVTVGKVAQLVDTTMDGTSGALYS